MKEHGNTISEAQIRARLVARSAAEVLLPTEVTGNMDGLQRARRLVAYDRRNLIVMTTHPSEMDEPREYSYLWGMEEFLDRQFHVPNASDQNTLPVRLIGSATGVKLYPIVTQDVKKRDKTEHHVAGFGNIGYFKGVKRAGASKDDPCIFFLAPDAGRRSKIRIPNTRAAELLMTALGSNFAVLFVGVEIDGVEDYTQADGKNMFTPYTLRFGDCFTNEEIITKLHVYREWADFLSRPQRIVREPDKDRRPEDRAIIFQKPRNDRPFYGVENWMYETQFLDLVPDAYK